jgi:predicted  nucleic acid-binding Zn-ribbon protein
MVRCDRCGSRFSYLQESANEYCPRCQARDGAMVPLTVVDPEPAADDAATSEAGQSSDGGSDGPVE